MYYYESNAENIKDDYVGETKCRFGKHIKEHQWSDKESAIVKILRRKILIPINVRIQHSSKKLQQPYTEKLPSHFSSRIRDQT